MCHSGRKHGGFDRMIEHMKKGTKRKAFGSYSSVVKHAKYR